MSSGLNAWLRAQLPHRRQPLRERRQLLLDGFRRERALRALVQEAEELDVFLECRIDFDVGAFGHGHHDEIVVR